MLNHSGGDLLHTMAIYGLSHVRTELYNLFVIPFLAPHPEQTDGELRAMATLATRRSRRIGRCKYFRRHSASPRTAACAASTSKKRNSVFPCLLICLSR